jgi:processing peptidase subunit beta
MMKSVRLARQLAACFSQVTRATTSAPARRDHLQFSKHRLVDFGELPHGEIPEALRAIRPAQTTRLSNEVRVGAEVFANGQPA